MELTLTRTTKRKGCTLGVLAVDGKEMCDTMERIRIHAGNLPADTEGCILVGEYNEETRQLECSTLYVRLLKQRIVEAKERGEGVWITVK